MKNASYALLSILALPLAANATCTGKEAFGTYCKLFAANSPWNAVPINPVLSTNQTIPTSSYYPTVAGGPYSVGVFQAAPTDQAVTVKGNTTNGVWMPDALVFKPSVTIPHWPAGVKPASGSDGHADIVDEAAGIVHSFWQLKHNTTTGAWTAQQYTWAPLNGRGWGDPGAFMVGPRSSGVPASGGVIRIHEVDDGEPMYHHALAMSLTFNGLAGGSNSPTSYVYPATSADSTASQNTGVIPLGARMMLPASFNVNSLSNLKLRKVARTLQVYGAMVVDRNYGTPYVIYVENGAGYNLMPGGWDNPTAHDLQVIRAALRPLASAGAWRAGGTSDAYDAIYNDTYVSYWMNYGYQNVYLNMLSMREVAGPYTSVIAGSSANKAVYDSTRRAAVFPASTQQVQQSYAFTNPADIVTSVTWAKPQAGANYKLSNSSTGGASVRLVLKGCTSTQVVDSGWVANGQNVILTAPASGVCKAVVSLLKPSSTTATSAIVKPRLIREW